MSASVIEKLSQEFAKILDIDDASETIEYLFNIDDESDVREYLNSWIDVTKPENLAFSEKLLGEWKRVVRQKSAGTTYKVYQKYEENETYFAGKQDQKKGKKSKQKSSTITIQEYENKSQPQAQEVVEQTLVEKKKKYVPLFSQRGQERSIIRLPGRHICNCQASKHKLINNCLKCGRIVCEQEGSGPCTFCGSLVCTKEEQEILDRHSKKSEKLLTYLMNQVTTSTTTTTTTSALTELSSIGASIGTTGNKDGLANAVKHKEKLLEYDRNCVKRTQVIDDECDYFSMDSNPWLTKEEKSKLKKREEDLYEKKYGSRKEKKITIDFAGRRIVEENPNLFMYDGSDKVIQEVYRGVKPKSMQRELTEEDFAPLLHPNMTIEPPKFINEYGTPRRSYVAAVTETDRKRSLRLQDAELMEMTDQGKCLSMHQPWASLLVAGIKKHEGRTWYTTHRGRLWIASTMKDAYKEDVEALEEQYKVLLSDDVKFPEFYPKGSLLGCVEVVECLPQQEYREQYPDGDSDSPYVFICRNPHELSIKFPVQGQHKIYRLDAQTHKAAKLGIMRDASKLQKQMAEQ